MRDNYITIMSCDYEDLVSRILSPSEIEAKVLCHLHIFLMLLYFLKLIKFFFYIPIVSVQLFSSVSCHFHFLSSDFGVRQQQQHPHGIYLFSSLWSSKTTKLKSFKSIHRISVAENESPELVEGAGIALSSFL